MKLFKNLLLTGILSIITLSSCSNNENDDELNEVQTEFEKKVQDVNSNILTIQALINAYDNNESVTAVMNLEDGEGYSASLTDNSVITFDNHTHGTSSIVNIKKDSDNKYYWTFNGEWIKVGENKICANSYSDNVAVAPITKINDKSHEWEISTDNGQTWINTGVEVKRCSQAIDDNTLYNIPDIKGKSAIFTINETLTEISLNFVSGIEFKIGEDDSNDIFTVDTKECELAIKFADEEIIKENDIVDITAKMDIPAESGANGKEAWNITVKKPTLTSGKYNNDGKLNIIIPDDAQSGDFINITVVILQNGNIESKASRSIKYNVKESDIKEYKKENYFQWDAYSHYVTGAITGKWESGSEMYNTTAGKDTQASQSCINCPSAKQIRWYLGTEEVYWDNGDINTSDTGLQTFKLINGETSSKGVWIKKAPAEGFDNNSTQFNILKLDNDGSDTSIGTLKIITNENAKEIRTSNNFFFLPAAGFFNDNIFENENGYYWCNNLNNKELPYYLLIRKNCVSIQPYSSKSAGMLTWSIDTTINGNFIGTVTDWIPTTNENINFNK